MSDEEEIKRMINLVQTSLHDQVSALKSDVQRAVGDSEAALEIGATLEKTINELKSEKIQQSELVNGLRDTLEILKDKIKSDSLQFRRLQTLAGMSHLCWHLSMRMLIMAIPRKEDEQSLLHYLKQLLDLIATYEDFYKKVKEATTVKETESLVLEFADRYFAMQNKTFTKE
jgi:molybdopterin converting factor small subunit